MWYILKERTFYFLLFFFPPHSTFISFVTKPVRALQRAAGEEQFCQVTAALQPYDVEHLYRALRFVIFYFIFLKCV